MGGIAQLAKSLGIEVSGCDAGVYPPMSDQLKQAGIHLIEGYDPEQLDAGADLYIIGNAISRGNPLLEEILNRGLPYTSGPQWLQENILNGATCWQLPVPTVKPQRLQCWPGFWKTAD